MKTIIPCFAIVSGAVLGLVLGFTFRNLENRRRGPETLAQASGSNLLHSAKVGDLVKGSGQTAPVDDSPLATRLSRDLSMTSGVTNWLCWWQALDQAMPSDFPRLLRLAKGNRLMTRMVAERWAEIAPDHFFHKAIDAARCGNSFASEVTTQLLDLWVKGDSGSAVAALKQIDDFPGRADWRRQVAGLIIESNTELGLQLMAEWHIENYSPNLKGAEAWAGADPRHAAEFTLANPAGYVSTALIQTIGREWAKTAPGDALAFALSQHGNLGSAMANGALQTWASHDLNAAAEWLASADPSVQNKLCPAFVETWAKQDASNALEWCESNVSGSGLIQSVSSAFKGAADKDVRTAAQLVLGMQPSPARAEAAAVVAAQWFPALVAKDKPVSPETLSWLNGLDPDSAARVLDRVQWQWAETDPASMAAFLLSANSTEVPTYAYEILGRDLARKDPGHALDWAGQLPSGRGLTAGCAAFSEWGRSQPDIAMQWWSALPTNDARRQPFLEGLLSQLAWDAQANSQFAQVAANDPQVARKLVASMNLDELRRTTLLSLLPHQ